MYRMEQDPAATPPAEQAPRTSWGEGARFLLIGACIIIVTYGLQYARPFLVPILMATFLAIISYSFTKLLRRFLRFPHWLAVASTVAADGGIIFGVISLINFLAQDMKATLQGEFTVRLTEKYNELMTWLGKLGVEEQARALFTSPQDLFNVQQVVSVTQLLTSQVLSFMTTCTLVLIVMTFMLGEAPLFGRNLRKLPNSAKGKSDFLSALNGIQRYLFIKTIASLCTGALAWVLCYSMDVPFAFLWGVVAFVLNYIPTIGSIVAAIPPILMALLMGGIGPMVIVSLGYIGINFMIGNGIEPIFLGKQFGIATTVIVLSVLFWGWVWGPFGMLLAMPMTVLLKLALENSRDLAWIAVIIDDNAKPSRLIKKETE